MEKIRRKFCVYKKPEMKEAPKQFHKELQDHHIRQLAGQESLDKANAEKNALASG